MTGSYWVFCHIKPTIFAQNIPENVVCIFADIKKSYKINFSQLVCFARETLP